MEALSAFHSSRQRMPALPGGGTLLPGAAQQGRRAIPAGARLLRRYSAPQTPGARAGEADVSPPAAVGAGNSLTRVMTGSARSPHRLTARPCYGSLGGTVNAKADDRLHASRPLALPPWW